MTTARPTSAAVHPGADRRHLAGPVGAEDDRPREASRVGAGAAADPDIAMIQRGGAEPHEHLAGAGRGIGSLLQLQAVGGTGLTQDDGAHGSTSSSGLLR